MILAIVQARTSSSRMPGKVLKKILGKPMIVHEIERIKKSALVNKIVLATSAEESDDALAQTCGDAGIEVFRGNLNDVLDRYYQCAKEYQPEHVVRVTGDCPLIDWELIDAVIEKHRKEENDYTSNVMEITYPDGLDTEVMRFAALKHAWQEAKLPSQREHVTPYLYQNRQLFKLGCKKNNVDLSAMRWTVDEPEDFIFVTKVYEYLYPAHQDFMMRDIIELLELRPELQMINHAFTRNEGLKKSLEEDQKQLMKEGE